MGNRAGRQRRRGKGNTGLHGGFAWAIASLVTVEKKKDATALAGGLAPGGEKGEERMVRDATNTITSLADPLKSGRLAAWPPGRLAQLAPAARDCFAR